VIFLNKAILVEILKTYPGSAAIESKYRSQIKTAKPVGSLWEQSKEKMKKTLGFNNTECSEAAYLTLRALIDEAIDRNNIAAWKEILCIAGEAANKTFTTSYLGSELCNCAFALRAYILYKIDEQLETIRHNKFNKSLNKDQLLARKIKELIDKEINDHIEIIKDLNKVSQGIDRLNYGRLLNKTFPINVEEVQRFLQDGEKISEIAQRLLYFLGHDSPTDLTLILPETLFNSYPTYNNKEFILSRQSIEHLKHHLPMYLQPIYIAIHLRNKRPNLKTESNERTVIASFEQQVLVRIEEEEKEALRTKRLAEEEESQKNMLIEASPSIPIIPEREDGDVPRLDSPKTPKKLGELEEILNSGIHTSPVKLDKEKKYENLSVTNELGEVKISGSSLTISKALPARTENPAEIKQSIQNLPTDENAQLDPGMTKSYIQFYTNDLRSAKTPSEEEMKQKMKKKNIGGIGNAIS
jgi:hypothetical protein